MRRAALSKSAKAGNPRCEGSNPSPSSTFELCRSCRPQAHERVFHKPDGDVIECGVVTCGDGCCTCGCGEFVPFNPARYSKGW